MICSQFSLEVQKNLVACHTSCRSCKKGIPVCGLLITFLFNLFHSHQMRSVLLINNPALSGLSPSLAYRRDVGELRLYCTYVLHLCPDEHASIIPLLSVRPSQKRRSTHSQTFTVPHEKPMISQFDRLFIIRTSDLLLNLK